MFKIFLLLVLFIGSLNSAYAKQVYCTTKNWETSTKSFKKNETKYNNYNKEYKKYLKDHDATDFVSKDYDVQEFSKLWKLNNPTLTATAEAMKTYSKQESDKLKKLINKLKTLKTRFTKTKTLWSDLAEYCYDEDVYNDYKGARTNMRTAISSRTDTEELIEKVEELKKSYDTDIRFITRSKQISEQEEGCGCSVK